MNEKVDNLIKEVIELLNRHTAVEVRDILDEVFCEAVRQKAEGDCSRYENRRLFE